MDSKRHKRKTGYTVMIISDYADKKQKKFHVNTGILYTVAFVLLLAIVCYAEYTAILSHGATTRSEAYVEQIAVLQSENEQLKTDKEALEKQVANLNQNLIQKEALVQMKDETLQAAEQEKCMPKGFPMSGAAQIKEVNGEDDTGMQPLEEQKEIIFVAAASTNVTAAGAGTVSDVTQAAGEPVMIRIDHGNGYISTYRNTGMPRVEAGTLVDMGAVLFEIGNSNLEIGYSISKGGEYLDPMEIIEIKG